MKIVIIQLEMSLRARGWYAAAQADNLEPVDELVTALIAEHGKLRILVIMHDFHGWTAGAVWEDLKFDFKHSRDIEKVAMVGDAKWEQAMAAICKPFTGATIRYFDHSQLEEARTWIAA